MQILSATDTEGDPFVVNGGIYQVVVTDWQSELTIEVEAPDGTWIETDQSFDDEGVKVMYLSASARYRANTSSAGAQAWVQSVKEDEVGPTGMRP